MTKIKIQSTYRKFMTPEGLFQQTGVITSLFNETVGNKF